MTKDGSGLDWGAVSLRLWGYYAVCFVGLWTPGRMVMGTDLRFIVCAVLGSLYGPLLRSVGEIIRDYEPVSNVDAKRTNEQIKSTAGMLNTFATASVSVFALSELRAGFQQANLVLIMLALGAALYVHSGARRLLSFLKDEAVVSPGDTSVEAVPK